MTASASIIEAIGIKRIAAQVGVVETAVTNAKRKGIPGRWYGPVKTLCDEEGIDCPLDAFRWAQADDRPGSTA